MVLKVASLQSSVCTAKRPFSLYTIGTLRNSKTEREQESNSNWLGNFVAITSSALFQMRHSTNSSVDQTSSLVRAANTKQQLFLTRCNNASTATKVANPCWQCVDGDRSCLNRLRSPSSHSIRVRGGFCKSSLHKLITPLT